MLTVNTLNIKKKLFQRTVWLWLFSSEGIFSGEGEKLSKLTQTVLFIWVAVWILLHLLLRLIFFRIVALVITIELFYIIKYLLRLASSLVLSFKGLLCDLLWSDPDKDVQGWGENDRGVSFTFGADVVSKFLNRHDLDLICRAHQVWILLLLLLKTFPAPYQ